ncbi:unnamed protein product [Acanthoscelides obtectus]|uniref:Uncharacterized protein n=1 Tax=Acanthoscelides obtectus TaxID=200917 RepID=A0A9P0MNE3_ACAOB|nr:unnamed protein product [Acanthoscelides obtectus]CAK1686249.1 hypothetical protein AOBTE_LOCUS35874 [Acanthoscelides obtectus]
MTTRPIANKYREGKLKSTLKREFKKPVSTDTGDGRATVPQEEAPETNSCEEAGIGGGSPIPVPELLDVSAVAAIAGGENNVNNITPTAENISPTQTPDMSERVLNVSEDELVSPAASPEEILWRQDVAQTARSCKLTRAAQQHLELRLILKCSQLTLLVTTPIGGEWDWCCAVGASRKTPSKKRLVTAAGCDLD